MAVASVAAVDLGATSGRVMHAQVGPSRLRLEEVARFPNRPVRRADGLHWDFAALRGRVLDGLRAAGAGRRIDGIGIDSWGVDYGLLVDGGLHDDPFQYRDPRTAAAAAAVHARLPFAELYARNGLQFLPFNTLYQLASDRDAGRLADAESALLIPDLFVYLLTGERIAEITNASTTGLLPVCPDRKPEEPEWDAGLIHALELPRRLFPRLVAPGSVVGPLRPSVSRRLGFGAPVIAVASHDTASAVVAAPMSGDAAAYVSCGTWGLVGVELAAPVVGAASRDANFTNERGVDGRIRFLRNAMGLWLLNQSLDAWAVYGTVRPLPRLLAEAAALTTPVPLFDVDDARFMAPGDMPQRIARCLREHDSPVPRSQAGIVRSIVESLALAYARSLRAAAELSGQRITTIHVVGGGAQIPLLCQAIADRTGTPVVAGPVEATAIGNVLVQARALGVLRGDLETLRALVGRNVRLVHYKPRTLRHRRGEA